MALGETSLLSAKQKMEPTWSKWYLVAVMTYKVIAADCTWKFLLVDRVRRKKRSCIVTEEVYVLFHVLQSHLKQAQSASAGMCAVQPEITK